MKKKLITHPGFTILEVLIYMGVSAILLVSLTQIFFMISRLRLESEATSSLQQDGAYLLLKLSHDIAGSTSITTPTLGLQGDVLQTNKVRYSLDANNRLQVTDSIGTDVLNSYDTSVSDLNFYHLGGNTHDSVRISFTLTSQVNQLSGYESKQFITTVATK